VAPVPTDREVTLRVFVKPMVLWLWIGGAVMAIGTIFAAFPGGRRRRPTEPVSAPVEMPESEMVGVDQ
jgi:cytochrome c-type biogenesis protein CcmF